MKSQFSKRDLIIVLIILLVVAVSCALFYVGMYNWMYENVNLIQS